MVKLLAVFFSLFVLFFVIDLVRRHKLTFKYAFGWIGVSVLAVLFAVFDDWLFRAAAIFGFELPSNFVFFTLLSVFVILALLMTVFLAQQDQRNSTMAQKIAILESELEEIKKEKKGDSSNA